MNFDIDHLVKLTERTKSLLATYHDNNKFFRRIENPIGPIVDSDGELEMRKSIMGNIIVIETVQDCLNISEDPDIPLSAVTQLILDSHTQLEDIISYYGLVESKEKVPGDKLINTVPAFIPVPVPPKI